MDKKRIIAALLISALTITSVPIKVSAAEKVMVDTLEGNIGIDVSRHNGTVDWAMVKEQGIDYVMIKTGDGSEPIDGDFTADVDEQFETNYAGAGEEGLKRGIYHMCSVRDPEGAVKNAEYCLKILDGRPLEYPVAYDMELAGTFAGGKENTTAIAKAFCETIANAGYTPMIYTYADRAKNDFNWEELSEYKVWIAAYTGKTNGDWKPELPIDCDMWQFTERGNVLGANTNNGKGTCDLNFSYLEAESVEYEEGVIKLGVKETYTPVYEILPFGCTDSISFKSSDKTIATVSKKGKITAKKAGIAVITVTTGSGAESSVKVKVKKTPKTVKFSVSKKTLGVDTTYQLKTKFSSGAYSNKLKFASSDKTIATVSKTGKVKAKKKGTATITVTTYNDKKTTIKIVVK